MNKFQIRNIIAVFLFGVAKVTGMGGVACGFIHHVLLGKFLLLSAGLALLSTIILCVFNMKEMSKEDSNESNLLRKMMEEGTLRSHLKQIGYQ